MTSFDERVGIDRISKDNYYLGIARSVSMRSTCLRRQYGAVIVKNNRVVSTGYNGAAKGVVECCSNGRCLRNELGIKHGEPYELCQAVHSEANAIIQGTASEMEGATLYLAGFENGKVIKAIPCMMCRRMILNARIDKVIATIGDEDEMFTTSAEELRIKENEEYNSD